MREQQNYRAAIYCRLSSEDGADHESMSIGNQRALLTEYVVVETHFSQAGHAGTIEKTSGTREAVNPLVY